MVEQYTIQIAHNRAVIVDEDGARLNNDEYSELFKLLKDTERIEKFEHDMKIVDRAEWIFIEDPNDRHELFSSGPCVYFLVLKDYPHVSVKIGYTKNLCTRTRSLEREHGPISVLAYAKTWKNLEFERALHFFFADYQIGNTEWFETQPVIGFLEGIKGEPINGG